MKILSDFDAHHQPLCVLEFNQSVSREWRSEVLEALDSIGKVATLVSYSKWTVEPK